VNLVGRKCWYANETLLRGTIVKQHEISGLMSFMVDFVPDGMDSKLRVSSYFLIFDLDAAIERCVENAAYWRAKTKELIAESNDAKKIEEEVQ